MTEGELLALPFLFEFWALAHQLPPEGAWKTWVILGGRGAGKTRAGSEWVRAMVEGAGPLDTGIARRVALVGETMDQAREVMIFGESGILACSPPDRRPKWHGARKMLEWPNGAVAQVFSAFDPESLRGPQFDACWVDELAKWPKARETWDMVQFGLRLGEHPRQVVTTTPRNVAVLKEILALDSTVVTKAATEANAANLAASFLSEVRARYGTSALGRQELDGEILEDVEGALWSRQVLERARVDMPGALSRVVVAVDPPVSTGAKADTCGIVVVGAMTEGPVQDWRAVVLEDASVQGCSPVWWAEAAIAAMARWEADLMVAEVNQGGDLVQSVVRQVDPLVAFKAVHARVGKSARAEPVAALYEQGRVAHMSGLDKLEDQMCLMTVAGFQGQGSPDRVDALVWGLHEVVLEASKAWRRPAVRAL